MNVWLVDLEAVETRYTKQWKTEFPKLLKAHGHTVRVLNGGDTPQATTPGAFLNFGGTNVYKSNQLMQIGVEMQTGDSKTRTSAQQKFNQLKVEIRKELESIVSKRDATDGLETLKRSLALSGRYRDLLGQIQAAESQEQLDALYEGIQTEKDVYEQRARHLQQLFEQRTELIRASNINLDDVLAEVQQLNPSTTNDCDF